MMKKINYEPLLFLGIPLSLIAIFFILPIIYNFVLSFSDWNPLSKQINWIGLKNYQAMAADKELHTTLINTVIFTIVTVPTTMAIAVFLAVLLNKRINFRGIFRTIFFLPNITSFVAAGIIWIWMLNFDRGIMNFFLNLFGISSINWLQSSPWAFISVILMTIWKNAGYFMVIYLAGLQSIPKSLYEAASIDGADKGLKTFRYITWPLLRPTNILVLTMNLIFAFRTFEQVYIMTKGGPFMSTEVLVYYIYKLAFGGILKMGYAAAVSMILLVAVLTVTFVQNKLIKKDDDFNYV